MGEKEKTGPGLREQNKLRVRAAIRRAGVDLVARNGFQAVSVDDIAAAAGVARTTFFNYFPSKEAVLAAPSPDLLERQRVMCASRPADEPLWRSLSAVILDLIAAGEDDLRVMKHLKAASPELGDLLHKSNVDVVTALAAWASGRVTRDAEDEARLLVTVFLTAAETCVDQWPTDQPISATLARLEELYERLGRAFDGL
ncbi:TetR family transcriptional regulator [Actinoplanes sp. NBRC 103695]|uniref:TetR family transcriptional regulator n=1 Tax=Actinoplanes sp. NBRC 103695 TaxID=3032202 RepID=UPI00249FA28F|nr:TetR family transcriptional regulator [Actinoplanes sp. NBRC 103695]GLY98357.1 TetR family transcriptional regulator [Actinoplanes sp. NBRC 103695]